MDALERCKEAILYYDFYEWENNMPSPTFEDISAIGVAYSVYETEHSSYNEQWYVSLEEDCPGIWLEINGEMVYEDTFIDLDDLADYLEGGDFNFSHLIAIADGYCDEMED